MCSTTISLEWITKGEEHHKELVRDELNVVFEGLIRGFQDDNEISKRFVSDIIQFAKTIRINQDVNETQDIPFITYEGEHLNLLKIPRCHKIVWAILDKYCTE